MGWIWRERDGGFIPIVGVVAGGSEWGGVLVVVDGKRKSAINGLQTTPSQPTLRFRPGYWTKLPVYLVLQFNRSEI